MAFPPFDLNSNLLSNRYKFNGLGTCLEETEYYWDGYFLRLVSAGLIDGIENGCTDFGVRSPYESILITERSVGPAYLGMTFTDFQAQLPSMATFTAIP